MNDDAVLKDLGEIYIFYKDKRVIGMHFKNQRD